ncbi:hypothetical protein [Microterricola viridarii]|uniref:Integral membrane protein n=1 Tax=Microterricola viridarii TaxID=412690 RepID=A0A1H1QF38_9MICO|nr:hypothetical protein [Microterricola viridarii]SDS22036.1 hypothetical protein SAMN04489834_1078 [Microterricola viridarii]
MARSSTAELEALVARLQRENAALRSGEATPVGPAVPHRRSRAWSVLSAVLIVIGLVLAPIAVVSSWAKLQLSSTDQFVATFAPLADDPAVQDFISAQLVTAIESKVDIPGITADLFDGLKELGLPPRAADALGLLEAPAVAGVQNLVATSVDRLVASDTFSDLWAGALRVSHKQLTATLEGDPNAALAINSGELGIQIGPLVDEVKKRLVAQGFGFAASIPAIELTVVVATADAFTTAQLVYGLAIAVGSWVPILTLVLLAAGVLLARRKVTALVATAVALGILMLILAAGFGIGRYFFLAATASTTLPSDAAGAIYDQLIQLMQSTTTALIVLAFTIALIAWFSGPYSLAAKLRGFIGSGISSVRRAAEHRGITTGRFGLWMYRQRVLVRVLIAVVASAVLLLSRPLHGSTIVWTAVLALLAVLVAELLQRTGEELDTEADAGAGDVGAGGVGAGGVGAGGVGAGDAGAEPAGPLDDGADAVSSGGADDAEAVLENSDKKP